MRSALNRLLKNNEEGRKKSEKEERVSFICINERSMSLGENDGTRVGRRGVREEADGTGKKKRNPKKKLRVFFMNRVTSNE